MVLVLVSNRKRQNTLVHNLYTEFRCKIMVGTISHEKIFPQRRTNYRVPITAGGTRKPLPSHWARTPRRARGLESISSGVTLSSQAPEEIKKKNPATTKISVFKSKSQWLSILQSQKVPLRGWTEVEGPSLWRMWWLKMLAITMVRIPNSYWIYIVTWFHSPG